MQIIWDFFANFTHLVAEEAFYALCPENFGDFLQSKWLKKKKTKKNQNLNYELKK